MAKRALFISLVVMASGSAGCVHDIRTDALQDQLRQARVDADQNARRTAELEARVRRLASGASTETDAPPTGTNAAPRGEGTNREVIEALARLTAVNEHLVDALGKADREAHERALPTKATADAPATVLRSNGQVLKLTEAQERALLRILRTPQLDYRNPWGI